MNMTKIDEVGDGGDCEDKIVKRSPSKNLNGVKVI